MQFTSSPRIAIIGAGPAGLTLARILQMRGIHPIIFERESTPGIRSQGGILDMKADSGQLAIRAAGLEQTFFTLARPEGQDACMRDKHGNILFEKKTQDGDYYKPEIDRGQLRHMLLDSLVPDSVQWNSTFTDIEPLGDGTHKLHFADGSHQTFDLIVGADGAWSRVRPLLTDAKPEYCGVMFIEIHFNNVDEQHRHIAELIGNGTMFALADNKALIGQRNSNNHIRIYIAVRVARDWGDSFGNDPQQQRAQLSRLFSDWAPQLQNLFMECEDHFTLRPINALPSSIHWQHTPGLTLVGDAAHLMSPFSGMGANLAMLDAADLAEAICTSPDITTAIKKYESIMFPRAHEAMHESALGLDIAIANDAPRGALAFFQHQ